MKILVVTQYFYPEQVRINDICLELYKLGNDVTVLTGRPNYPEGEYFSGYENYKKYDTFNGIDVIRSNVRARHKGIKNLIRNYYSFVKQCSKDIASINKKFDVVYVYGLSPISIALPAIKYKKKYRVPIYYYCLDIWPESVRDSNNNVRKMSKLNPIYIFSLFLSKYVYKRMDFISTKCDDFCKYLSSVCRVPLDKMNVIPEYAEPIYLNVCNVSTPNDVIDFVFMGNIGKLQNCEMIIKAAYLIKDRTFMIHFIGDGSDLERIKKMTQQMGLQEKIHFYGRIDIHDTISFYDLADVCLLTLDNKTNTGLTPPGKLYGYLASGRPILGSIGGEAQKIIDEAKCGFCVLPNDINAFADKMCYFIDHPNCIEQFGKNSRTFFIEKYTLDKYIKKTISTLELVVKTH